MATRNDDAKEVGRIRGRANITTGRPRRLTMGVNGARTKVAFGATGGTMGGMGGNFYSPELSTDFLELPQSMDEQRNVYRFFYRTHPFVHQAINIHTELPLSKIRLGMPHARNRGLAEKSLRFCEKWATRINLLRRLIEVIHEFHLLGEVFVFLEDTSPDMPQEIEQELVRELRADGSLVEYWQDRPDKYERAAQWMKKNYKGWTALRILPPEQVHMETFMFTDQKIIEFIPDSKTKNVIGQADAGDPNAGRVVSSMPADVIAAIKEGKNLPLNTDPDAGSFVHYLARKMSQYDTRGHSSLEPCLRALTLWDKCLVPGTPVWILRDGIIQSVPVETIQTETDLLLTHKGNFAHAIAGSRIVSEPIIAIQTGGVAGPLKLTGNHRVFVMTDAGLLEKEASSLKEGDLLCEAFVQAGGQPLQSINLQEWWVDRQIVAPRRYRRNARGHVHKERTLTVQTSTIQDNLLAVTFEYPQDDANLLDGLEKRRALLSWLSKLTEPTEASSEQVMQETGLSWYAVRNYSHVLRKENGLVTKKVFLGRGRGLRTLWYPVAEETSPIRETVQTTLTSAISVLPMTEDICYLLGTWLGDGDVWKGDANVVGEGPFGWTGAKGSSVLDRIQAIAIQYFGLDNVTTEPAFKKSHDPSVACVRVADPLFARFLRESFGHDSKSKHLPEWFFQLETSKVLAFLRGLLDTDGHLSHSRHPSIVLQMANPLLLDQVHLLCNRIGLQTNRLPTTRKARVWTRTWQTQGGPVTKEYSYLETTYAMLQCGRSDDVRRWAEGSIKGSCVDWSNSRISSTPSAFQDGYLTRQITKLDQIQYEGPVYSFDVPGDLSHTAGFFVVHNCRQAQTSIASRHMTPMRVVTLEKGASVEDVEEMRIQIENALMDPDYSIVTNYEINWQEMGSESRLLDLTSEYESIYKQLYAGLGITEALLTGESAYSGERISLDVINTRYMLLREELQEFVEQYVFKPMCARMGFIEEDEDGDEQVIVPKLTFTRLGLRDSDTTYEHMFALYTKGSLDVGTILELLNLDPVTVRKKIEEDMWSVNDPVFNEMIRAIYSAAGQKLTDGTEVVEQIAKNMHLKYKAPQEGRF